MPITPHLSRRLQQALGEEAALEFMNWIQRVDARSSDSVERLETVRADVAEVRQELQIGFVKLLEQMAHLETRFERRFGDLIKWSFVFWVGAVAAIAALAGVLR